MLPSDQTSGHAKALESLRAFLTFSEMDPKAQFSCSKTAVMYKKNSMIFREGDQPFGFFGVCGGMLKLYKTGLHGSQQTLSIVPTGGLVGTRALLADEPYSATAAAVEPSRVLFFSREVFYALLKEHGEMLLPLTIRLSKELGREREAWLSFSDLPAETRLARCLLDLQQSFSRFRRSPGIESIRFPRYEMASLIGVSPETVSRLLAELKSKGALLLRGRRIIFHDTALLRSIAELGRDQSGPSRLLPPQPAARFAPAQSPA